MESKIEINGVEYIRADEVKVAATRDGMRFCVVRCYSAGNFAGYVKDKRGDEIDMVDCIRMWRWHGRTLSGIAVEGPDDISKCKFGPMVPEITLNGVIETIPCTQKAIDKIMEVGQWVND